MGDGTYTRSNTPVTVKDITNAVDIAAGWYHSLAILSDGTVKAWGYSNRGQLGCGLYVYNRKANIPVTVKGITNAVDIAAGGYHSMAVLSDGIVMAWGDNDDGQLGDGTDIRLRNFPVMVVGIDTAVAVAADSRQTVALLSDGTVEVWGIFYKVPSHNTPVKVSGITDAVAVAAGRGHIVALLSDGTVKAWGHNSHGELGDGTNSDSTIPVTVGGM